MGASVASCSLMTYSMVNRQAAKVLPFLHSKSDFTVVCAFLPGNIIDDSSTRVEPYFHRRVGVVSPAFRLI